MSNNFLPVFQYQLESRRLTPLERFCKKIRKILNLNNMSGTFFFIQPILAPGYGWAALNWQSMSLAETDYAEFLQCFSQSAVTPLTKILPLVAPISPEYLQYPEFPDAFEKDRILFVLPSCSLENPNIVRQCQELRSQGARLAIEIDCPQTLYKVLPSVFDTIRFNASMARRNFSEQDMVYANNVGFKTIATHVDSHELFEWLVSEHVVWSDGYFLTIPKPKLHMDSRPVLNQLLKLLNLVKHDGDTHDIEAVFREDVMLSYNLLRLVNSVAMEIRTKINSLSQAIIILGRRQLQRWSQLLIYSCLGDGNAPNPLMQLAAARGRQMELLSAAIDPIPDIPELADNAFIIGLFSLLNALVNLPMNDILKEITLQDEIVDALTDSDKKSVLGRLLSAIIAGEEGDFDKATQILSDFKISPVIHAKSQVTAYHWASRINTGRGDEFF